MKKFTIKSLFCKPRVDKKIQLLVFQVEQQVRQLNGLSALSPKSAPQDTLDSLRNTCLLLERLIKQNEDSAFNVGVEEQEAVQAEALPLPLEPVPSELPAQNLAQTMPAKVETVLEQEPEPSPVGKKLIELRDYLLLANPKDLTAAQQVMHDLYQKLGQVLTYEAITLLEEEGNYNYQYQQVVGIQATEQDELDEMVCSTVRPGYLFQSKVLRPQEVIVYQKTPEG